jgi:SAM-dependent methyltransferase
MTVATERARAGSIERATSIPLPPPALRDRVHGAADVESFLEVGRQCAQDIVAGLARIGTELGAFESVLDFGCGCGRVLRWLLPELASACVFGTDIDRQAVAWCVANMPGASFSLNAGLPPTGYASRSFDLVYAISVFSHLDEDFQFYWLNELRRITRPHAIVLLSLHGHLTLGNLPQEITAEIEARGMKFVVSGAWQKVFPDWYQIAFHTREYVLEHYGRYFDVLDYIPGGMTGIQDLVVLRRRAGNDVGLDRELALEAGLSKLRAYCGRLERSIETKNRHILRLEQLIKTIESGRVVRLLRMITRS